MKKILNSLKAAFQLSLEAIKSFSNKEKVASILVLIMIGAVVLPPVLRDERLADVTDDPKSSGATLYSEGMIGEIIHLNPVFTEFNEVDQDVSNLIFSGLSKYDPAEGAVVEDIATHILDGEQTTYTFTLKNNVYWHDGVEVTADDIYFTFHDVIQSPDFQNPILRANFEGVDIEVIDTRTVNFTLDAPNAFFFTHTTVGLLPKHILGEVPVSELDTHEFNQAPVGSGPYMVTSPYESVEEDEQVLELEVFEDYYGDVPSISNIRIHTFPDLDTLLESEGQWHGTARVPKYLLIETQTDRLEAYRYELPQYTALFINTDAEHTTKSNVRLAISKAIDKTYIIDQIGYAETIDTPLLELNQDDWIHQTNVEEAMGALYDAGWYLNSDGIRENWEEKTLTLYLLRRVFDDERKEEVASMTAEIIRAQLAEVGIEIIIEAYENEMLQEKIKNREYDLLLYGQSLGYNLDTYSYWHSSQSTEYGLNLSNYRNSNADQLIEAVRRTFDPVEKDEMLNDLAEVIAEDIPAVFLYTPSYYFLVDERVQGIELDNLRFPSDRFATISNWYFN